MKIETIKKDNKKKYILGITITIALILTITFISTRAKYKITSSAQLASGTINYSPSDLELIAIKLQNDSGTYEQTNLVPNSGYQINDELSICKVGNTKQDVIISYENGYLGITKLKAKGTKCEIYLDKAKNISDQLLSTGQLVNENGYRFQGLNPNNYIEFNNETWRIIGIFEVEEETTNTKENLVKIIRDESIGEFIFSDNWNYDTDNWYSATLNSTLNNEYYNSIGSFANKGLTNTAKEQIASVKWIAGGGETAYATIEEMYNNEKNSSITWNGKIGLMYASDYGYASPKSECARTLNMRTEISDCKNSNWLYKGIVEWTFNANPDILSLDHDTINYTDDNPYNSSFHVRPSFYLKDTISIIENDRDGSSTKPYQIK